MSQAPSLDRNPADPPFASSPSAPVALQCSFELVLKQDLKMRARIVNDSKTPIYVFNRLWDIDSSGKIISDPENIYRFSRDAEFRLLVGAAPLPRFKAALYRNIPFATMVNPGGFLDLSQTIPLPLKEYSPYFPESSESRYQSVKVTRLLLIVQYVEAQPTFTTAACPFDPAAVKIATPGVLDFVKTVVCRSSSPEVDVMRRMDEFERLTLTGETPEPPMISK